MATLTGTTLAYLLASEMKALLFHMPDAPLHAVLHCLENRSVQIGESRMLTPESFDLDELRPFVKIPGSGHPA
ncbi:hypothetical protein SAMN05428958_11315 [Pantoea sesami]|nr:hypothetical protein SAMN05428958_11315 [Pantoea sesami]